MRVITLICVVAVAIGPTAAYGDVGDRKEHRSRRWHSHAHSDGHTAKSAGRRPSTVARCQADATDRVDEIDNGVHYRQVAAPIERCPTFRSAPAALTRTYWRGRS